MPGSQYTVFHYSHMSDETMKTGNSCYSLVRSVTTSSIQTRTPISPHHHNQMLVWWWVGSLNKRTSVMAAEEHIIRNRHTRRKRSSKDCDLPDGLRSAALMTVDVCLRRVCQDQIRLGLRFLTLCSSVSIARYGSPSWSECNMTPDLKK